MKSFTSLIAVVAAIMKSVQQLNYIATSLIKTYSQVCNIISLGGGGGGGGGGSLCPVHSI